MQTTKKERRDFAAVALAMGRTLAQVAPAIHGYLTSELDGEGFGAWLWDGGDRDYRESLESLATLDLQGWPTCECAAGDGCAEPATTTDEGVPVCGGCAEQAVFGEDGSSDCGCCGAGDRVVWDGSVGCDGAYVYDDAPAEPDEDPDGDWVVVGMDGEERGRYASAEDAGAAVEREAVLFGRASVHGSNANAYLPRSVCHVACGSPVRCGRWSTSWYVPGCEHAGAEAEYAD